MTTYTIELTTTKVKVIEADCPETLLEWITEADESDYKCDYRYEPTTVIYDENELANGIGKPLAEYWADWQEGKMDDKDFVIRT